MRHFIKKVFYLTGNIIYIIKQIIAHKFHLKINQFQSYFTSMLLTIKCMHYSKNSIN